MKRLIFISAGILILLSFGTYLLFLSSKTNVHDKHQIENVKTQHAENKEESCCSHKLDSDEISGNSIYQLESSWKNESNKNVKLSDFKDKKVVLSMIFANCTYACPIIINDMKRIESKMSRKELKETKFVLVSIDPERDTPESLYDLSKRQNLDLNRWTLLTGTKDDVRELAALFGFKYQKDKNGDYTHSNLINILDEDGEVVYQYQGLNEDISLAAEKISTHN